MYARGVFLKYFSVLGGVAGFLSGNRVKTEKNLAEFGFVVLKSVLVGRIF